MSTKEERKKQLDWYKWAANLCSNGNLAAEDYLNKLLFVMRVMDDLIDKDIPVSEKDICRAFYYATCDIPMNTFFLANVFSLVGLHRIALNAWQDCIDLSKEPESNYDFKVIKENNLNQWTGVKKDNGEIVFYETVDAVLREIFPLVASLTGGYDFMRKISVKLRLVLKEKNK